MVMVCPNSGAYFDVKPCLVSLRKIPAGLRRISTYTVKLLFNAVSLSINHVCSISACELPKTHRRYVNHKEAVLAVLSAPARFERECGFWCIGEPYGLETNGGIYLDQVPLSSKIYVVSNDHEWSDDICAKVEDCRPGSHPERITMEAVLTTFHWDSSSEDELAEDVSAFESAPKKMKLDSDQSMEGKIRQAPLESTTAVAPTEIVIR